MTKNALIEQCKSYLAQKTNPIIFPDVYNEYAFAVYVIILLMNLYLFWLALSNHFKIR
jgi:hypothetical protein